MAYSVDSIHHIGIPLEDEKIEAVKVFYTEILGFECTVDTRFQASGHRMVFLKKNDMIIEVYTGEPGAKKGCVDHICLLCTNIKELGEVIASKGYTVESYDVQPDAEGNPLYGFQFVWGPAGEYIELYEEFQREK